MYVYMYILMAYMASKYCGISISQLLTLVLGSVDARASKQFWPVTTPSVSSGECRYLCVHAFSLSSE